MPGPRTQPTDLPQNNPQEIANVDLDLLNQQVDQATQDLQQFEPGQESQTIEAEGPEDVEDIATQLDQATQELLGDVQPIATQADNLDRPLPFLDELNLRARMSFATDPENQKMIVDRTFGSEIETEIIDGELFYRKRGSNQPKQKIDLDFFAGGKFREFAGDVVDLSGDAAEAVLSAATELGTVVGLGATGAAIGSMFVPGLGTAVGFGAGATLGLIPAAFLGASAGVEARDRVIRFFGGRGIDQEEKDDIKLFGGLANVVLMGSGAALIRGFSGFTEAVRESGGLSARRASKIRSSFDDMIEGLGGTLDDLERTGLRVKGVSNDLQARLGKKIGAIKRLAEERATLQGIASFPTRNYSKGMKQFFEDLGGKIVPIRNELGQTTRKFTIEMPKVGEGRIPMIGENQKAINEIIGSFKKLTNEGGFTLTEIDRQLRLLSNLSDFDKNVASDFANSARRLRGKLSKDRYLIYDQLLKNVPEAATYRKTFREFSNKAEIIGRFNKKIFKNENVSPEQIMDKVIRPNNVRDVRKLKFLLGEDSSAFKNLSANWVNGLLRKSLTPDGVVDSGLFRKQLRKFGPKVINELIPPKDLLKLNKLLELSDSLPKKFVRDVSALERVKAGGVLIAGDQLFTQTIIDRLLIMFSGGRGQWTKYLTEEALPELAEKSSVGRKREQFLKVADWLQSANDRGLIRFNIPKALQATEESRKVVSAPIARNFVRRLMEPTFSSYQMQSILPVEEEMDFE